MSALEQLMQVALVADEARKASALRVLRGEAEAVEPGAAPRRAASGPLLLNMGQAAALLGVSRATLWRLIQDGRLPKVELRRDSFRIRREDLEALVEGGGSVGSGQWAVGSENLPSGNRAYNGETPDPGDRAYNGAARRAGLQQTPVPGDRAYSERPIDGQDGRGLA